jgi:hypothetical protein
LTRFCHRNALTPHSTGRDLQGFEESKQSSGVVFAVCSKDQRRFVTCLFRKIGQMPVKPPRQRAEPEDRTVQQ